MQPLYASRFTANLLFSLLYYGLTMNGGSLAGDPFLNNTLLGLMEVLASVLAIFMVSRLGLVKTITGSLFVAAASCLLSSLAVQLGRGIDGKLPGWSTSFLNHC